MNKNILLISLVLFFSLPTFSQTLPIFLDGMFSDWENNSVLQTDNTNDGLTIDFKEFSVTNDNKFLYIKVEFTEEIKLSDNNQIILSIDTDNALETGWSGSGIGSELDWYFGQRRGYFNIGDDSEGISFSDITLRILPTVTSNIFEIAISRDSKPDGVNLLFLQDTIRICISDFTPAGDKIPNDGDYFTYVFDNSDFPEYEQISLTKENPELVRFMTYNIKADFNNDLGGLNDPSRTDFLNRIFSSLSPEIITINEAWDTSIDEALEFINNSNPLAGNSTWYADKTDGANITLSQFPIIQTWRVLSGNNLTACLIDLSEKNLGNVLVISAHLKCCDDDPRRQEQADAFAKFILDCKNPGGIITLPKNTPFILMGDMNFVGESQQLTTLVAGDIQDTLSFGNAQPLDWDNTNLTDLISYQTENRMAYTWRNDYGSYVPGRLDFMIYSDAVMEVEKTFILQTELMPDESLQLWGLEQNDTRFSSDHLPKVADFRLPALVIDSTIRLVLTDFLENSIFHTDSIFKIRWTSNFVDTVKIDLIQNDGEAVQMIATNLIGINGLYNWKVSKTFDISKPYSLVISEKNNLISDTSSTFFFSSAKDDFTIFPNPSSGVFYMNFENTDYEKQISVYDILGKLVLEKEGSTYYLQEIDLSSQKSGIYFVKITMKRFTYIRRISVQGNQ